MRSNRNKAVELLPLDDSIDDWEMRSNRNIGKLGIKAEAEYRRLGNAL